MQTPPPLPVVLALTALIEGLFEAVGARFGVFPIRGPLVRFLWKRLFRIQRHFACLAARVAAGKDVRTRPSRPRRALASRDAGSPFRLTKWVKPNFGWLCRVVPGYFGASAYARELAALLATDSEMLALLAATPATARILAPLCWMLGVAAPATPVFSAATPCAPVPEPTYGRERAESFAIAAMPRPIADAASRRGTPPPGPPELVLSLPVAKAA